jgi:hypothetical protein
VTVLISVAVTTVIVINATGNGHVSRHHSLWVDALSWIFAFCAWTLVVIAAVVLRNTWKRRSRE